MIGTYFALTGDVIALAAAYFARRATVHQRRAQRKLDAIAALEVHGREFVDAAQLYAILGRPIPEPIDHAANLRARVEQIFTPGQPDPHSPYRSPYT